MRVGIQLLLLFSDTSLLSIGSSSETWPSFVKLFDILVQIGDIKIKINRMALTKSPREKYESMSIIWDHTTFTK